MLKKRILTLLFLFINFNMVFATNDQDVSELKGILGAVLQAVSWLGYMIAFGMLIYVGIIYATSGTREKANMKGKLVTYLAGILLIVLASLIVSGIANVAGNENAGDIVDSAVKHSGGTVVESTEKEKSNLWNRRKGGDYYEN